VSTPSTNNLLDFVSASLEHNRLLLFINSIIQSCDGNPYSTNNHPDMASFESERLRSISKAICHKATVAAASFEHEGLLLIRQATHNWQRQLFEHSGLYLTHRRLFTLRNGSMKDYIPSIEKIFSLLATPA